MGDSRRNLKVSLGVLLFLGLSLTVLGQSITNFAFSTFDYNNHTYFAFANMAYLGRGASTIYLTETDFGGDDDRVETGAVWFKQRVRLESFVTTFTIRSSNNSFVPGSGNPDGIAFVIQNQHVPTVGPGEGGLGYGDIGDLAGGIKHSIAVEFDTYQNTELGDPSSNHVAVHTKGATENSADISAMVNPPGAVSNVPTFAGNTNTITVTYRNLTLTVSFPGTQIPSIVVPNLNLPQLIGLDRSGAYIGFTSSCAGVCETNEILSWTYNYVSNPDPTQSYAYGPGLNGTVAGTPATFTIQAVDQYGYPMVTGGLQASVFLNPPNPTEYIQITDNQNGTYTVSYMVQQSGSYSLIVSLNEIAIRGSPYPMVVSPAPIALSNTLVTGALGGGIAGNSLAIYVQARDVYGNNITSNNPPMTFVATFSNGLVLSSTYLGNAMYVIPYRITVEGTYALNITLNGNIVGPNPNPYMVRIAAADPSANTSIVWGAGLVGGMAGTNQSFAVYFRDVYGNPILYSLPSPFALSASFVEAPSIPITLTQTVNPNTNGTIIVGSYTLTVARSYTLNLQLQPSGASVAASPYTVLITPGVVTYPPQCIAYGSGLTSATAGSKATFTIQARDVYGNNQTSTNDTFVVSFTSQGQPLSVPVNVSTSQTDPGKIIVTYTPTLAATYTIRVTDNGADIMGSPFNNLVVRPGPVYPPLCYAQGGGLVDPQINVVETFIIYTVDQYNNPLVSGGQQVSAMFQDRFQNIMVNVSITDLGTGAYSAQYTLTKQGNYALSVLINGQNIQNSPFFYSLAGNGSGHTTYTIVAVVVGVACVAAAGFGGYLYYKWKQRSQYTELGDHH